MIKDKGQKTDRCSSLISILLIVYCLLSTGCTQDPLLKRTGADYLPLAQGNTWTYECTGKVIDTITVKVTGTTTVAQREAWIIERDGCPTYWWKSDDRVDKFFCETQFFDGEEDTIFATWLPWLHIPFVLGETKSDSFTQQIMLPQDTILTQIYIDYKVSDLHASRYKIEITLIKNTYSNYGEDSETYIYEEWYSPEIGMTRRDIEHHFNQTIEKRTEKLISFSLF